MCTNQLLKKIKTDHLEGSNFETVSHRKELIIVIHPKLPIWKKFDGHGNHQREPFVVVHTFV